MVKTLGFFLAHAERPGSIRDPGHSFSVLLNEPLLRPIGQFLSFWEPLAYTMF